MLTIPDGIITDNGVTECFTARKIKPATGMSIVPGQEEELMPDGIGYMIIEQTFIVA